MDGTTDPKDTSGVTQDTSEGTKGTSEQPETFTKDSQEKAVSDALSKAGRDAKSITDKTSKAEKLLENAQGIMDKAKAKQQQDDEAELEAAKGDNERLSALQERQAHRGTKSELAESKRELSDRDERLKLIDGEKAEATKESSAREIATRLDVDANSLVKLAKLTDGSKEAIEEIASSLPKKGETKPSLKLDPGGVTGGGEKSEQQKLDDRYPTMKK